MFPAARITDPITHDLLVPCGAIIGPVSGPCPKGLVLIQYLPAAHLRCSAACTGVTAGGMIHPPPPAPPPPPIMMGSPTVLIHGLPACRWFPSGDVGACGVFLGDPKLTPMRSVFIGGPSISFNLNPNGGNTIIGIDHASQIIYVISFMEYIGPDATDAYADHASNEIEETWSGSHTRDGQDYDVRVIVNTLVNPGASESEATPGYDTIIVDSSTNRMTQSMHGNGPGNQTPAAADPNRRRIAHEYGHTLGLPDEYHDTPTGSVPDDPSKTNNIMAETWPDADGNMPHPHPNQYDQMLDNYGY